VKINEAEARETALSCWSMRWPDSQHDEFNLAFIGARELYVEGFLTALRLVPKSEQP
jgi:hypothetical protein